MLLWGVLEVKWCGKLGLGIMWGAKVDGHVRCMVGIAVWGRMYGNREFGGEPGSLLRYIIEFLLPVQHGNQLPSHMATKGVHAYCASKQWGQKFCRHTVHAIRQIWIHKITRTADQFFPRKISWQCPANWRVSVDFESLRCSLQLFASLSIFAFLKIDCLLRSGMHWWRHSSTPSHYQWFPWR